MLIKSIGSFITQKMLLFQIQIIKRINLLRYYEYIDNQNQDIKQQKSAK